MSPTARRNIDNFLSSLEGPAPAKDSCRVKAVDGRDVQAVPAEQWESHGDRLAMKKMDEIAVKRHERKKRKCKPLVQLTLFGKGN